MPSRPIAITVSFIMYRLPHPMNASSSMRSSRGSGSGRDAPIFSGVFEVAKEDWIDVYRRGTLGDCTDCTVVGLRLTVYDEEAERVLDVEVERVLDVEVERVLDVEVGRVLDVEADRVFEVLVVGVRREEMRVLDCV